MPMTKPDTELLLLAADSVAQLRARAQTPGERAGEVSLGALSAQCAEQLDLDAPLRAAIVAPQNPHVLMLSPPLNLPMPRLAPLMKSVLLARVRSGMSYE